MATASSLHRNSDWKGEWHPTARGMAPMAGRNSDWLAAIPTGSAVTMARVASRFRLNQSALRAMAHDEVHPSSLHCNSDWRLNQSALRAMAHDEVPIVAALQFRLDQLGQWQTASQSYYPRQWQNAASQFRKRGQHSGLR